MADSRPIEKTDRDYFDRWKSVLYSTNKSQSLRLCKRARNKLAHLTCINKRQVSQLVRYQFRKKFRSADFPNTPCTKHARDVRCTRMKSRSLPNCVEHLRWISRRPLRRSWEPRVVRKLSRRIFLDERCTTSDSSRTRVHDYEDDKDKNLRLCDAWRAASSKLSDGKMRGTASLQVVETFHKSLHSNRLKIASRSPSRSVINGKWRSAKEIHQSTVVDRRSDTTGAIN